MSDRRKRDLGHRTIKRHQKLHRMPVAHHPAILGERNVFVPAGGRCAECGGPLTNEQRYKNRRFCSWDCWKVCAVRENANNARPIPVLSDKKAEAQIVETGQWPDEHFYPLVLYLGNLTLGRSRALLNVAVALKDANVDKFSRFGPVVFENQGVAHLSGLHGVPQPPKTTAALKRYFNRLYWNPQVTDRIEGMTEFVRHVFAESGYRAYTLDRLSRFSYQSTRPWRKKAWEGHPGDPVASGDAVWPYLNAFNDHPLVASIDAVVPKGLPAEIRADVCQDIAVAMLSGEIKDADLGDRLLVGRYIKDFYERFPHRYGKLLSLDATYGDGNVTLGDMLVTADQYQTNMAAAFKGVRVA